MTAISTKRGGATSRVVISLIAVFALSAPALAQDRPFATKNVTLLGISSGTVAPRGLGFVSLSFNRNLERGENNGGVAFGLGFGDAVAGVGFQATGYLTDLDDGFAESGFFELKASRALSLGGQRIFGALSVRGGGFGNESDRPTSGRLAFSGFRNVQAANGEAYPVMWTLGLGSHERDNHSEPGLFGGIGVGLTPNIGASLAWEGEYVNVGASFRFEQAPNLRISASVLDVFDQEDRRSVNISVNYFFRDLF